MLPYGKVHFTSLFTATSNLSCSIAYGMACKLLVWLVSILHLSSARSATLTIAKTTTVQAGTQYTIDMVDSNKEKVLEQHFYVTCNAVGMLRNVFILTTVSVCYDDYRSWVFIFWPTTNSVSLEGEKLWATCESIRSLPLIVHLPTTHRQIYSDSYSIHNISVFFQLLVIPLSRL